MLFDAVEQVYVVVLANFTTDLGALATAKGVSVTATAGIIKRQTAPTFLGLGADLPAIGVYATDGVTQAKDQGKRDTLTTMVLDYYAEGTDPANLAKQAELAAEALLQSVDRLWPGLEGGGGNAVGSIGITMTPGYQEIRQNEAGQTVYNHRATVTFPVMDRDTV